MQKLIKAVSRNWLSLLLLLALLAFSSTFLTNVNVSDGIVCAKDDASAAVCIRNWANSAGNLLTGLVALVAALIAFNQLSENRKQVSTALLPPLKERLDDIAALHAQATVVSNEFYRLVGALNTLRIAIDGHVVLQALSNRANAVISIENRLNVARKKLNDDAHNVRLYADISIIAKTIVQEAYQRSNNDAGILLNNCKSISESSDDYPEMLQRNMDRFRRELFYFDRATLILNEKHRQILVHLHTLASMAGVVNDKRLAALALADRPDDPPAN